MELYGIKGLSVQEAEARKNSKVVLADKWLLPGWVRSLLGLFQEPMILLLLIASGFYLSSGQWHDGLFLSMSVIVVASISLFQDARSSAALDGLKTLTSPKCKVIRDGTVAELRVEDLVVGDAMIVEEGGLIPADGTILHANDFYVNESVLTGESLPILKNEHDEDHMVYYGTSVTGGLAMVLVTSTGSSTRVSRIGKSIINLQSEKTPLQKQINGFVSKMAILGVIVFIFVWFLNYLHSFDLKDSLLKALTLAMSILPEEIPVAFTTFMAMGAWKLMKMDVLVKDIKTVEALGSATVICVDKTGTLTQNKMSLAKIWSPASNRFTDTTTPMTKDEVALIETAMWASEPIPFDPMEKAIHDTYGKMTHQDRRNEFQMAHEYPLSGKPPMMTHIFADKQGHQIVACKGAPEAILSVSGMQNDHRVLKAIESMASLGYRILAVGEAKYSSLAFPATQQQIPFIFKGLIAFYDPPKENITQVLKSFYGAGIEVKIITGDNASTSAAIAQQIGFKGIEQAISGEELMSMSRQQLQQKVSELCLFTRMFPEAKLRVIDALKDCGDVVAMTGDGVNDGPALKAAHIGIAMGKRGTEIAKGAATLILMKDDLQGMVDAIALGRRIYSNLKKAVRYIISIHIPIILIVFIPLVLGWVYPNLFSPVHIIFLELVMGPTCSLVYENEPIEPHTMEEKPRRFTTTFFSPGELAVSVIQGMVIGAGLLLLYQYGHKYGYDEAGVRSMVFTALMTANIVLTLVNRSFYFSVFETIMYKNKLIGIIISITSLLLFACLYINPLSRFFEFTPLGFSALALSIFTGMVSAGWYEFVKWYQRTSICHR